MKKVDKDTFYDFIGPQDVCVRVENVYKYPYTILFELRQSRKTVGKVIDVYANGTSGEIVSEYFINRD